MYWQERIAPERRVPVQQVGVKPAKVPSFRHVVRRLGLLANLFLRKPLGVLRGRERAI